VTAENSSIHTLLEVQPPPWTTADGLLTLLSASATASPDERALLFEVLKGETPEAPQPSATSLRFVRVWQEATMSPEAWATLAIDHRRCVAWTALEQWLGVWDSPPSEANAFRRWLVDVETLGLASLGLAELKLGSDAAPVAAALSSMLDRFRVEVSERSDHYLFAGDAEKRLASLGGVVPPWNWFRAGTVGHALGEQSDDRHIELVVEIARLWVDGQLHTEDAKYLSTALHANEQLRASLRDVIRDLTAELSLTRWNPAWSTDVARTNEELGEAAELLRVRFPHISRSLKVRQHAAGTWWDLLDGTTALVPFETEEYAWRDAVLGDFRTKIDVHEPASDQDVWHGLTCLKRITRDKAKPRGLEVVDALLSDLCTGNMAAAVRNGHQAFEAGSDVSLVDENLLNHAFELRLAASDALEALSHQGIDVSAASSKMVRADEIHREHSSAVQLVDDDLHESCTELAPAVDPDSWWGCRYALDRLIPSGVIETALHGVATDRAVKQQASVRYDIGRHVSRGWQLREPTTGYPSMSAARHSAAREFTLLAASAASTRPELPSSPCSWLRPASSTGPTPGCVPLMLLDEANDRGVVAELRVVVDEPGSDEEVWSGAASLRSAAREAIRTAYNAVGSCTPFRAPPFPFAAHRFELLVEGLPDSAELEVDGRSVGLPVALAFASAWCRRAIAPDIAGIGAVRPGPNPEVSAVGGVAAKARALSEFAKKNLRVILSRDSVDELAGIDATSVPSKLLGDALAAAGVDLKDLPAGGETISDLRRRLRDLVEDVRDSNRQRHGPRATWGQIGDEIRRTIALLGSPQSQDTQEAKCWAAFAYSHDGMLSDVDSVLREVARPAELHPGIRALYDIAQLGWCIDNEELAQLKGVAAIDNLKSDLVELQATPDRSNSQELIGRATGTLGRAYMHMRRLDVAIPLLEEAVLHHVAHAPHEAPRSRMYLAMALRMRGEPKTALEQLAIGRGELETVTRQYSWEYEASCRTYLDYETARVMVSLERSGDAVQLASEALQASRWSFWPQLGIRRTLAWALRMLDREGDANAEVDAMRDVWVPPPVAAFAARLIREAEGYPVEDGEIY
jgi:hypothetical protein